MLGQPQLPAEIATNHIASMKPGTIVSSATPPKGLPLIIAASQRGKFVEFLGPDIKLYPMRMLEEDLKTLQTCQRSSSTIEGRIVLSQLQEWRSS